MKWQFDHVKLAQLNNFNIFKAQNVYLPININNIFFFVYGGIT